MDMAIQGPADRRLDTGRVRRSVSPFVHGTTNGPELFRLPVSDGIMPGTLGNLCRAGDIKALHWTHAESFRRPVPQVGTTAHPHTREAYNAILSGMGGKEPTVPPFR